MLFTCCSNLLHAQTLTVSPTCFGISVAPIPDPPLPRCNSGVCEAGTNSGNNCSRCFDVTISGCGDELPQSFQITSNECFSICSPTGDFTLGSYSAGVCNNTPKQIVWKNATGSADCPIPPCPCNGMLSTDHATFRICGSGNQTFHIALIYHCGYICTSPCTDATITLP